MFGGQPRRCVVPRSSSAAATGLPGPVASVRGCQASAHAPGRRCCHGQSGRRRAACLAGPALVPSRLQSFRRGAPRRRPNRSAPLANGRERRAACGTWAAAPKPHSVAQARARLDRLFICGALHEKRVELLAGRVAVAGAQSDSCERQLRVPCVIRSEEHTSELQSLAYLVCRLLLEKKKKKIEAILVMICVYERFRRSL